MKQERIRILAGVDIEYGTDAQRSVAIGMVTGTIEGAGGEFGRSKYCVTSVDLYEDNWKEKYEELLSSHPKMLNNKPVIKYPQERNIYIFGVLYDDSIIDDLKVIIEMDMVESITVNGEVYLIEDIKKVV